MDFLTRDKDLMLFGLDKSQYSQRGAVAFILVYFLATLFGAVLTPPLYWLTEYVNSLYSADLLDYLLDKGIDKYFDRLRWVGVIVGLPCIFKYCGLSSISSMGLSLNKDSIKNFLKYFALGFCVMIFIYAMQLAFTNMGFQKLSFNEFSMALIKSALGGLILGLLEELVFRGLIFRCFYTAWGVLPAMLLSSLFFAYKHFKVPRSLMESIDLHTAHWYSGFSVAYYDSVGIFYSFKVLEFCSLTILSLFLCSIYMRTKTLYAPIAFHMAIVFSLKTHRELFIVKADNFRDFFGNAGATNSYIAVTILSFLLVFSLLNLRKKTLN